MALNKFMHPRNIYKTPTNFAALAKLYPEFSTVSKLDVSGKVTIDFKDPNSLRILTKCLLQHDFNLVVDIPHNRLVPTLPLRLNYILWVEDLLASVQRTSDVHGLDIGTGACAIYPLLAAVKNKWNMVGTETDGESFAKAEENIQKNNLQGLIKCKLSTVDAVKLNKTTSVIDHIFNGPDETSFDFCMCNPPFYSTIEELCESRSPARLPPKNGFTGSPHELITEGGELQFCRTLINESKQHEKNVLFFTTMVGHKYNFNMLLQELKSEGIKYTYTEFCQGRVTRWGLAWTFKDHDIYDLVPPRDKERKKNVPSIYLLPALPNVKYDVAVAFKKIKEILENLKINFKVLEKRVNNISLNITANSNTWSHQRRKRRLMKRQEIENKKLKLEINDVTPGECSQAINQMIVASNETKGSENTGEVKKETPECGQEINEMLVDSNKTNCIEDSETLGECSKGIIQIEASNGTNCCEDTIEIKKEAPGECSQITNNLQEAWNKQESNVNNGHSSVSHYSSRNGLKPSSNDTNIEVHALIKLLKKGNDVLLEIVFIEGSAGKEGMYQIVQYIKNNWK